MSHLIDNLKGINLEPYNLSFQYEASKDKLRTKFAYKNFIKEILEESNTILVFTLTFNDSYKTSLDQAEKDARHFKNTLDKGVFGKSNNKWKNRHAGCLVVEGNDYNDGSVNTHIHGILGFSINNPSTCKKLITKHWNQIRKSGFINEIKEIIA